jgi:hypothetical protein
MFFFEKKNQKTSIRSGFGLFGAARPRVATVFCFFSSEKKNFLLPAVALGSRLFVGGCSSARGP